MDLLFLVKNLKQPQDNFNILNHIRFVTTSSRLGSDHRLAHNYTRCNKARHFYFNRVVRLWKAMPRIDLQMSYHGIESLLSKFFWENFIKNFDPDNLCTYHVKCPCSNCLIHPKIVNQLDFKTGSGLLTLTTVYICIQTYSVLIFVQHH